MSFKGLDRMSLLTLQGRILVPFIMGTYQSERFSAAKGSVIWSGGATANGSCW